MPPLADDDKVDEVPLTDEDLAEPLDDAGVACCEADDDDDELDELMPAGVDVVCFSSFLPLDGAASASNFVMSTASTSFVP